MIFSDDFLYVIYITAVPIVGSYSLVIRTIPHHPPPPYSPVDQETNVIIVIVIRVVIVILIVKIIATTQNLLREIYLTQIQLLQYLVILVLTLVTNI